MTSIATSPLISSDEALSLVETILKNSQAEDIEITLTNREEALTRFSDNQIIQNINRTQFNVSVTSYFGKRCATTSTNELDPDAITATIRRSEELAQIAPEDPEWVPRLQPQTYDDVVPAFDEQTANLSPLRRGEIIQQVCQKSATAQMQASGALSTEAEFVAIANSQGLRVYGSSTTADFSITNRINTGSAWTQRTATSVTQLPFEDLTDTVIQKAQASQNPREIQPGVYPVILEGPAFADLLEWVVWNLDARAADEGRSFMSRTDEQGQPIGNRVGEPLFSPLVQVFRSPNHPLLQTYPFSKDGLRKDQFAIIQDGTPQTLSYSRYWAQQQGKQPTGSLYPIVMQGSDQSVADLIKEMERGILVSRAWYVRYINPRTLEVTGMTRDGTFWIEDGQIAYPIKNLRFNQSLPQLLQNVESLSHVNRSGLSVVPGVRVKAFNFSSITDSI